jgi:hypothetical protein
VSERLGRDSHERDIFRWAVCTIKAEGRGERGAWAVAHRITKVVWLLLHEGVEYQEKGVAPANPRTLVRQFRRLTKERTRPRRS